MNENKRYKTALKMLGVTIIMLLFTSIPAQSPTQLSTAQLDTENMSPNDSDLLAAQIKVEEIKQKFDSGFEKKINDMKNSGETRDYDVIILVKKAPENGLDAKSVAKQNKDKLENELKNVYGVKQLYKAQVLSFITARVPLHAIDKLAEYDYVVGIGDGELETIQLGFSDMNQSKALVNANNLAHNGSGILVGIVDLGILAQHNDLPTSGPNQKIAKIFDCGISGCIITGLGTDDHNTHVAGIVAGLGINNQSMIGVAPGSKIIILQSSFGGIPTALDQLLVEGGRVATIVVAFLDDRFKCPFGSSPLVSSIEEAVDEGLEVNIGMGNKDAGPDSMNWAACAQNVISVGAVDETASVWSSSSIGPTPDGRIKPELVAPGVEVNTTSANGGYTADSGTSFSTPFVSGAAAIILQAHPEYSPLEVKAALLVGANWTGNPVPMNATFYENNALQFNATLNARGFGLLDVNRTLTLANTGKNVIHDVIGENQTKRYTFSANQNEQVKVILSWLKHTLGNVTTPVNATTSNLDFKITRSDTGAIVASSTSMKQNNEFAVFNAPVPGSYIITVSAPNVSTEFGSTEIFALASTHQLKSLHVTEGTFTKTTATGNQIVTGLGFKPKALLLFTTRQSSQGTTDVYNLAFGFSNGSSSRSVGVASDDNAATSNAGRAFGTQALRILSSGTPTVTAQANLASFDSDGFTLNWTTNDSTASIIHYVALGGSTLTNAAVSSFVANTATGNQAVPVGFKPDFVMFMHAASTTETGTATHGYISYGFATFSDRGAVAVTSEDGRGIMDTCRVLRTDKAIVALVESACSTSIDAQADIVSMDPNGFTINWLDAPASADRVYYLALKGGQYDVGNFAKTTTTGNQNVATVEFKPDGLLLTSVRAEVASVQSHNRLSFGATDGALESTIWSGDGDGAANSITARSTTTSKVIRLATEQTTGSSSTINAEADLVNMTSDGFNLNWTTNGAVAAQILYAAFGVMTGSNIIIVEETIPDNARDFNFTSSNFPSFLLDDDTNSTLSNTKIFADLSPGTYSISQTPDANYTTTSSCSDGSPVSAIAVGADETVTCKFVNKIISGVATGDILVTDQGDGATTPPLLFKVNPTTGARTVLSDFNNTGQGTLGSGLFGVTVDASGDILVTGFNASNGNLGSRLFKVDPTTGTRTVLSDFDNASQGTLGKSIHGITVDASGDILVGDEGFPALLFKVDPTTGTRTVLSNFSDTGQGTLGLQLLGITVDSSGDILVIGRNFDDIGIGLLFKVDPTTGARTVLSDFSNAGQGTLGPSPIDVEVDASGDILVIDQQAGTGEGLLFKVDPTTGARTVLSDFGNAGQGTLGANPFGVVDASGDILVIDVDAGTSFLGTLFKVNPTTGARTVLSDFGNASQGTLGSDPPAVAVYSTP